MKKALAILLAIGMVFAVFADAPVVSNSVVEFKGAASLEWISDLDAETNGFKNTTEAAVKINLFNAGDAATSGDGIWGELKIVTDKDGFYEVKDGSALAAGLTTPPLYAKVDTAKIHFVDGDVGIALNILKPGLALGENVLPTAVGKDKDNDAWKSFKFDVSDNGTTVVDATIAAEIATLEAKYKDDTSELNKNLADAKDELAKAVTLTEIDTAQGKVDAAEKALKDAKERVAYLNAYKKVPGLTNGFALEITSSVIDANFKVLDNGVAADKEWGFGADATIKAVENMNLKAGFAYAFETTAFLASADYKLAIDEKLYVKPAVAFGLEDKTKELAASALFGWGAEGQEPDFIKYDDDNRYISNKCADGFSVTFITDMADGADQMIFGLYDSTLLAGLKVGAEYYVADLNNFGKGKLSLAAKYGTDIDILTVALDFGMSTIFGTDKSTKMNYAIELSTDDVVDNTTLYAKYAGGVAGEKTNKGKITVGAKIAL